RNSRLKQLGNFLLTDTEWLLMRTATGRSGSITDRRDRRVMPLSISLISDVIVKTKSVGAK
ncbi:hypothetical protein, partial [Paraburkholderia caffeinilytica]|uniref:hypothetical protein n=1 Tax=Paraburkholderia caffeinilytica TaxID=1761016 RepID=UPI0038BA34B0